jgi:hypothetical protein
MEKSVVYVELQGGKPLPDGSVLRIAANGCKIVSVSSKESALKVLSNLVRVDILLSNQPERELFRFCRQHHPQANIILLSDLPMEQYSLALDGEDDRLVDHVIANRLPSPWTVHECRITIQKIVQEDIFGIEKYLLPGAAIRGGAVTGSACRESFNHEIQKFAEEFKFSGHQSKIAFGICEELLMNAIYDAPVAAGKRKHHGMSRAVGVELELSEQGRLTYGCDDQVLAIAVSDPFGSLEKSVFFKYLSKVKFREDSSALIDRKSGGAGLGLFKILFGAHSLICNVEKGKKTEVIALIETKQPLRDFSRMTRSIHYFEIRGAP